MKKRTRQLISTATAILLINAANTYFITTTDTVNATPIEIDGKISYFVPPSYIPYGITGKRTITKQIDSILRDEDYLLVNNEIDTTLKLTPKPRKK